MTGRLAIRWSRDLVASLLASGVARFVLSPGSRSTPLALACAELAADGHTVIVDERAAGFFALGAARALRAPVALICTSGTAGAHYFPSVVEASMAGWPLLVITADRPVELQHAGASQTIDQTKLFGDHVRLFLELGAPDPDALALVPALAARAVAAARAPVAGPVHMNARFRKPLEPEGAWPPAERTRVRAPRFFPAWRHPAPEALAALGELVRESAAPLVVLGPSRGGGLDPGSAALRRLAAMGWLCAAEIASGQLGFDDAVLPLATLSRAVESGELSPPDLVIELGLHPVSGKYSSLVASARRVVVGPGSLRDPLGSAVLGVECDDEPLLHALAGVEHRGAPDRGRTAGAAAEQWARIVRERLAREQDLSEPTLSWRLARALKPGAALFIGNGLPVRDMERYGASELRPGVAVYHQRGAAGIDGLVAGAAGVRAALSRDRGVVAVLGDVSAAHDLGSLSLLRERRGPLIVLVANNGGGRIFEELPIAESGVERAVFERLFATPPGIALAAVAASYDLDARRVETVRELEEAMGRGLCSEGATVIEAVAPPVRSRELRAALDSISRSST